MICACSFHSPLKEYWLTISDVDIYVVILSSGDMDPTQNNMHLRKWKTKQSDKEI